jgi:hypothetical protein
MTVDEALLIDALAVYEIGRQLAGEDASEETWRRYRERRDCVLAAADVTVAA